MALAPKIQARQGQQLAMTPQLQQAIKLLQLSNIELAAFVDEQLEKNPLLERGTGEENRRDEAAPAASETAPSSDTASDLSDTPAAAGADMDAPARVREHLQHVVGLTLARRRVQPSRFPRFLPARLGLARVVSCGFGHRTGPVEGLGGAAGSPRAALHHNSRTAATFGDDRWRNS